MNMAHKGYCTLIQQNNLTFQQDNARPYVARIAREFLNNNNIHPLDWPPYSPDLSQIEHLWGHLDGRVRQRQNSPVIPAQLRVVLVGEWDNIPIRKINSLMNSIHRRIRAVERANGGYTRYWMSSSLFCQFWFQTRTVSQRLTNTPHRKLSISIYSAWEKSQSPITPVILLQSQWKSQAHNFPW